MLKQQYSECSVDQKVLLNIDLINETNTFTVTTGHQLNIFTGPLYFIYKIVTVINACKKLSEKYPEYNFIPVYWMASEDHDLEEIRSFSLFGQKYTWETGQTGPVGRMDPTSLAELIGQMPEKAPIFEKAYTESATLAEAVRKYVNELFGTYGLVVIDADSNELKRQFKTVIKDDILNHHANDIVETDSSKLTDAGYGAQVFPRAINFFYMFDSERKRIVKEDGQYRIMDTEIVFNESEIIEAIEKESARFSPNVILRPLYQEMILPNIAYVGGPAEVAYWLQLKGVFDHYQVPLPAIMPRNFAMAIGKGILKRLNKLNIKSSDIFNDFQTIKAAFLESHSDYHFTLESEIRILNELFESVLNKAKPVDPSLEGFVGAERAKSLKSLDNIEKRIKRAEENKEETNIKQIQNIKDKLFPNGSPQERSDNFLNFFINDKDFIAKLIENFEPFDYRFNVLLDD